MIRLMMVVIRVMVMMKHIAVLCFSVIWVVKYEYDTNTQWYHLVGFNIIILTDDDNYQNDNGDGEGQ